MKKRLLIMGLLTLLTVLKPADTYAMHISEGFLPLFWCIFWFALSAPIVGIGIYKLTKRVKVHPEQKMLIGVSGAFTFVLSALKMPSVSGSSSHPTGVALGAILFGPATMSVLGTIVLLFQGLLLAHGGLTTLGANVFAMAIVGPFSIYYIYKGMLKLNIAKSIAIFTATFIGNLLIYITTSLQLALAFNGEGFLFAFSKFASIFAITQIPLAIIEGILTVLIFNFLFKYEGNQLDKVLAVKGGE